MTLPATVSGIAALRCALTVDTTHGSCLTRARAIFDYAVNCDWVEMSSSSYLEPVRRAFRNRRRIKDRVLPTKAPAPFVYVQDIAEVCDYFTRAMSEMNEISQPQHGLNGHCFVCKRDVVFSIDVPVDGGAVNWRETLMCPGCNLINRWRSCLHVFEVICKPAVEDRIYLTETLSPIYQNLRGRFPFLISSEYFPDHEFGKTVDTHVMPVRNEDVTKLSFADASMDIVLCFDVLEHVPDYRSALSQFFRVLDKGGQLVLSVPFSFRHETNVRAKIDSWGNIEHLVEPSYHGDPLSDKGVLSYYDFGMELLDDMYEAGFKECFLLCYCSKEFAYLSENVVFVARKL